MIVLLVKKDGGFRPIGIFMSPIRIYSKARFDLARCWEENRPRPCLYGGPSRGAQRAAWIASFTAEHAGLVKSHCAQVLLDLTTAFELFPHDVLIRCAIMYGYPL